MSKLPIYLMVALAGAVMWVAYPRASEFTTFQRIVISLLCCGAALWANYLLRPGKK